MIYISLPATRQTLTSMAAKLIRQLLFRPKSPIATKGKFLIDHTYVDTSGDFSFLR